jgi:hypothetical protein
LCQYFDGSFVVIAKDVRGQWPMLKDLALQPGGDKKQGVAVWPGHPLRRVAEKRSGGSIGVCEITDVSEKHILDDKISPCRNRGKRSRGGQLTGKVGGEFGMQNPARGLGNLTGKKRDRAVGEVSEMVNTRSAPIMDGIGNVLVGVIVILNPATGFGWLDVPQTLA